MKFYISLPISGHTDDDIEQRIDMAKVVIEKYVKHIQDKDLEAAGAYTKSIVGQLDGFKAFDDIYDPVRLNDDLELSDDATDNSYDNPSSIVALGEDIKFIISSVDILVLCDGWQDSKGCILEFMTALLFGKKVLQVVDGSIVCPKGREVLEQMMTGSGILDKSARVCRAMPFGFYNFK